MTKIKRIPISYIFAIIIAALLLFETELRASDAELYVIFKDARASDKYSFKVTVFGTTPNSIISATVTPPGGSPLLLVQNSEGEWEFEQIFDSIIALDSDYPDGAYIMNIIATNDGSISATLNLNADQVNGVRFPNDPRIINLAETQAVDPRQDFTLTWDAFANGNGGDFIIVVRQRMVATRCTRLN